jgi:stringent starvation protein B
LVPLAEILDTYLVLPEAGQGMNFDEDEEEQEEQEVPELSGQDDLSEFTNKQYGNEWTNARGKSGGHNHKHTDPTRGSRKHTSTTTSRTKLV